MKSKKYIVSAGVILTSIVVVVFFQNCGKNGVESNLSTTSQSSTEDRSGISGGSSSDDVFADKNCSPGSDVPVYKKNRALSGETCESLKAKIKCPSSGKLNWESQGAYLSVNILINNIGQRFYKNCGVPCSAGEEKITRRTSDAISCSDTTENTSTKTCVDGYADISAKYNSTECKPEDGAKACKIVIGADDAISGTKLVTPLPAGRAIMYSKFSKSLFCQNAEVNPFEEKTCVDGKELRFKYTNAECKPIVPTQLTHYVRMIWKDRLIKIHKYTYDATNKIWNRNTVWDKNKTMTYPKQGNLGSSQRKIFDTIGFRLNSALYLADSNDINKFQNADTDLNSLVSNLEEPGMYVESVIDVNNLDLAKDAKKFSAYDYGLMYPDLTEYLSKTEVKNADGDPDFSANPWNKFPCSNLPKATGTGFTDWTKVYADADKTKTAYQCAYDTLYAIFGPNDNNGSPIPDGKPLEDRNKFRTKFIVGLKNQGGEGSEDQGGEGPEFDLFYNHYKDTSISSDSGGTGTSCDKKDPKVCEFRNPNLLFDDVAYYYQYIYGSGNYGEIFDQNDVVIHSLSGLGFRNYQSFGIFFKGSTVSVEGLSQDKVAQPFIPRFDEVAYLQDPKNFDVLQSVYIKTLKGTNAQQDKLSGLAQYVKFGRSELRRGYYLARPMF